MAEIKVFRAQDVAPGTWGEIQDVLHGAWDETINRDSAEIRHLISGGSRNCDFIESHINPNTRVGSGLYANQLFTRPRVAIAAEKGKIVGYAYTASNVSGGGSPEGSHNESLSAKVVRQAKRMSVIKNYVWVREVAVLPEFQGQGIAKLMGKTLLEKSYGIQPVSAYVWPEEDGGVSQQILEGYGFYSTGEEELSVFGPGTESTIQVRMQADSVKGVIERF